MDKKTVEQRVEAASSRPADNNDDDGDDDEDADDDAVANEEVSRPVADEKNLSWLKNLIRNRDLVDAIVTRHIFDKLKKSGVSREQIVELLVDADCPLDFALLAEDVEVTRTLLERRETISREDSFNLVELAMRSSYMPNVKALVRYGPGADDRCGAFLAKMFDAINAPSANLTVAKRLVETLMQADVIDERTLPFVELTLETGRLEAVKVLLDCQVDDYVRRKFGEDVIVHLFGNVNADVLGLIRGRPLDVDAKCGDMAALHFAALARLERNVDLLLKAGADPNIRDCHGMTPLFAFGDDRCIELLLRHGADVQAIADNGYTIFDMMLQPSALAIMLAQVALIEAQGVAIKPEIRGKIAARSSLNDAYLKRREEIERMSGCRVRDDLALDAALLMSPEYLARFVDACRTRDRIIDECYSLQVHAHFCATLERNVDKAFVVHNWRRKAVRILLPIFELVDLEKPIVEAIVDYLNYNDLILIV